VSEAKFTPGPWKAEKRDGDEWWFGGKDGAEIVIFRDSEAHHYGNVAVLGARLSTVGKADADAQLISAAPDLFEALHAMCEMWVSVCKSQGWEPEHLAQYGQARAALAKALGEAK